MHLDELVTRFAIHSTEKQYRLAELVGDRPWRLSLEAGRLSFGDDLAWAVQVLGTESYATATWLWAWGNRASTLPPSVVEASLALRAYGTAHGVRELEERTHELSTPNGYVLSTVASGLLDAGAYYRAPFGDGAVYLLVTDPTYPRDPASRPGGDGPEPSTSRMIEAIRKALTSFDVDHVEALEAYADLRGASIAWERAALTLRVRGRPRVRATLDDGRITRLEPLP